MPCTDTAEGRVRALYCHVPCRAIIATDTDAHEIRDTVHILSSDLPSQNQDLGVVQTMYDLDLWLSG